MRHRFAVVTAACLTAVPPAAAQELSVVPPIQILGFADVDYLETDREAPEDGFFLGQLVGHVSAGLSERLTLFNEVSATARPDGYRIEVERLFLRYDFSDAVKLGGGRYHTQVSWWNTAFHHGLWLQTTVARPRMIEFGTELLPVHFVGLLVEGSFPTSPLGLGYTAGLGNGRGDNLARGGDAGDVNNHRAWLAHAYSRPARLSQLQVGGAVYGDRVDTDEGAGFDETIVSAHAVWTGETPELLAEVARIRHDPRDGGAALDTDAWYVQGAYRLPGRARALKPYLRFEDVDVPAGDPLFAPFDLDYRGTIVGIRYDLAMLAALKAEVRRERFGDDEWFNSLYMQASFAFGETGSHEPPDHIPQPAAEVAP